MEDLLKAGSDHRRIIDELLGNTREPIISFWLSKETNLTKPQLEILTNQMRWEPNVRKELKNARVEIQDVYELLKIFIFSWNDLIGNVKLDPMVRTLAHQLKNYRNGVSHYDFKNLTCQTDFLLALLCIRKFRQLLNEKNSIDDIDQHFKHKTIDYLKNVYGEEELIKILVTEETILGTKTEWLSKKILEEVEFKSDEFVEYFHEKTIYQMDVDDIYYFCSLIFNRFPDELHECYENYFDLQTDAANLIKDFVLFIKLLLQRYNFDTHIDFPTLVAEEFWKKVPDNDFLQNEYSYCETTRMLGNIALDYVALNDNLTTNEKIEFGIEIVQNLITQLNQDVLLLEEPVEVNTQKQIIGKNSLTNLEIKPGRFTNTTYITNGSTYVCFGPKKFDIARDYYDDLKNFVETGFLNEHQEGEYQGHPVIILPDVSDPVLMVGKNKAELLLQYFDFLDEEDDI